jgi:hypothetical protein
MIDAAIAKSAIAPPEVSALAQFPVRSLKRGQDRWPSSQMDCCRDEVR